MNSFLDHYCERVSAGLWDEPFNAVSNIIFILVALLLSTRQTYPFSISNRLTWDIWALLLLLLCIGVGSTLWHLFAENWALWADRIPITLFISLYLICFFIRVLNYSVIATLTVLVLYHLVNTASLLAFPPMTLNGSLFYLPSSILLIAITIVVLFRFNAARAKPFLLATTLLISSLFFRTIDNMVCESIPIGTHFIWHGLVAVTIYYLMVGLINSPNNKLPHEN